MAKKRKTTKKGGGFSGFFSKKKKSSRARSKKSPSSWSFNLKFTLAILSAVLLLTGIAVSLFYMDRYIKPDASSKQAYGSLVLAEPGIWVNEDWKQKVQEITGKGPFLLDDNSAKDLAQKLKVLSWMDNIRVKTTPEKILVCADYRRPVALVNLGGGEKYYLDAQMVVMDYIPVTAIPTIEIKGIASPRSIPTPGNRWAAEDARAGVDLLDILYKMDLHFQQQQQMEKPLLDDIESVDVSNFAARKSNSAPHIFLNVTDGTTRVFWGAAWGQAARYLEQDEKDKLADLYQFFMDNNNSLQGKAKYIELRQM